jgi:hypothetical protein
MNFEMQKALMLAEKIHDFINYVQKYHDTKNSSLFQKDKLYQIKLLINEYKFRLLADELHRINQYEWDEKYSFLLVDSFIKGFDVIEEYVNNYSDDLFLLKARLYTLRSLSLSFNR